MIVCQPSKGGAHYWSWRLVEGRKCWFAGRHVDKSQLMWSQPEVVIARKHYTEADLGLARKAEPAPAPVIPDRPLEQTPQARIDAAFDALGLSLRPVLLDQLQLDASGMVAVAAVPEEAAATPPMLRNALEIPLMLGVIFMGYLLWRGIAAGPRHRRFPDCAAPAVPMSAALGMLH